MVGEEENYDDDDFFHESQQEFEASVVEDYEQDDFYSEVGSMHDVDEDATPIEEIVKVNGTDVPGILRSGVSEDFNVPLPEVTDPYILFLVREAEERREEERQRTLRIGFDASVSAVSTNFDAEDRRTNGVQNGVQNVVAGAPMMTVWENGESVQIPMEQFMASQPPALSTSFHDEDEEDPDLRMASAMATAMVAGRLGASDGEGFDVVHTLMERFLKTSVQVDDVGSETDLTKQQDADSVSQLPTDLPGALSSSSDEVEMEEEKEMKNDVDNDEAGESGESDEANKKNSKVVNMHRTSSQLMNKMRTSLDDGLHSDMWATALAEENTGVSATPERSSITAWGEASHSSPVNTIPLTSPLSSTTKSEMSALSDSDRIPLDRIARIMRGANGMQNSVTSSITSSTWSSDEEEEEFGLLEEVEI